MRSRPGISLFLSPRAPSPGETLRARVRLDVRSETPCESVTVTLRGHERRYRSTTTVNNTTVQHYHRRSIIERALQVRPELLRPGVMEQEFAFAIPVDAPPSYRSALASIEYSVEVVVEIPWWPDAHALYDLTVLAPSSAGARGSARAVTNVQGVHRRDGIALELSLADDVSRPGGALRGALALTGLEGVSLRRVELACVTVESALVQSSAGPKEVDRRRWVLHEGTPSDGQALRFDLAIPAEVPAGFESPYIRVTHHLEATAVVAWGRDVGVHLPLRLVRDGGDGARAEVPIVGRARHLAVWQQAAHEASIPGATLVRFDADAGQVVFSVHGLKVAAREESRGDTPWLVAEVLVAPLGLGLRVAERRWTDLGARIARLDDGFQRRFTVRAREEAQAVALLDESLCVALAAFDEAALDDEGAALARSGGVFQLVGLQRFLFDVQRLAACLALAIPRIPPPSALSDRRETYAAFARERGLTLRVGDLTLHGWSVRGVLLHTALRWARGAPVGLSLCTPIPESSDRQRWDRALADGLPEHTGVEGGTAFVECEIPRDPASLIPLAERFAELVRSIEARREDPGPYRQ